jgi:hypothetical protein
MFIAIDFPLCQVKSPKKFYLNSLCAQEAGLNISHLA